MLEIETRSVSSGASMKQQYRVRLNHDPYYDFWFGTPDNNREFTDERPSLSDLNHELTDFKPIGILKAVEKRLFSVPRRCGCDPEKYDETILAWTDLAEGAINYCKSFFTAPALVPNGQVSTLIHEHTHLADSHAPATADFVYGRHGARDLALGDRSMATSNGDNYSIYVESVNEAR